MNMNSLHILARERKTVWSISWVTRGRLGRKDSTRRKLRTFMGANETASCGPQCQCSGDRSPGRNYGLDWVLLVDARHGQQVSTLHLRGVPSPIHGVKYAYSVGLNDLNSSDKAAIGVGVLYWGSPHVKRSNRTASETPEKGYIP